MSVIGRTMRLMDMLQASPAAILLVAAVLPTAVAGQAGADPVDGLVDPPAGKALDSILAPLLDAARSLADPIDPNDPRLLTVDRKQVIAMVGGALAVDLCRISFDPNLRSIQNSPAEIRVQDSKLHIKIPGFDKNTGVLGIGTHAFTWTSGKLDCLQISE